MILPLAALLVAPACAEPAVESDPPAGSSAASSELAADACAWLLGKRFRSRETHPGGLGPDGPLAAFQRLEFSSDTFRWTYSDVEDTGRYRCADGVISARAAGRAIEARVDLQARELQWDGIAFEPAD